MIEFLQGWLRAQNGRERGLSLGALFMVATLFVALSSSVVGQEADESATPTAATPVAEPEPTGIRSQGYEHVAEPSIGEFPGPNSIQLLKVAEGLESPRVIVSAHDGTGRMFIGEQAGTIRILTREGELLPEPFVDITYLVASGH